MQDVETARGGPFLAVVLQVVCATSAPEILAQPAAANATPTAPDPSSKGIQVAPGGTLRLAMMSSANGESLASLMVEAAATIGTSCRRSTCGIGNQVPSTP
jgi:hypothetical protein